MAGVVTLVMKAAKIAKASTRMLRFVSAVEHYNLIPFILVGKNQLVSAAAHLSLPVEGVTIEPVLVLRLVLAFLFRHK